MKDKGLPVDNISGYDSTVEEILNAYSVDDMKVSPMVFVTKSGMIKTVGGEEFDVAKKQVAATKLGDKDSLIAVHLSLAEETLCLITAKGMFLRFAVADIPVKKKAAIGVRGIKLAPGDKVTDAVFIGAGMNVSYEYKGQEIALDRIRIGNRDTKGVKK
jgi:DNA gyrase subunit A